MLAAMRDLELVPLADRGLVDVAGEDQVGAGLDEPGQHVIPAGDGLLARAPGRASWSARPRWLRSPLAITSSGPKRSIRTGAPCSIESSSPAPKCRSERCRTRVSTAGAGYRLTLVTEESAEIFDDLYLGLRA